MPRIVTREEAMGILLGPNSSWEYVRTTRDGLAVLRMGL